VIPTVEMSKKKWPSDPDCEQGQDFLSRKTLGKNALPFWAIFIHYIRRA